MKRNQLLKIKMPRLLLSIAVLAILPLPSCSTQAYNCTGLNDCLNNGTCVNSIRGFSCACTQGFTGNRCGINTDDCAGHSRCLNGGTCVDGISSFTCACADAFLGHNCEHPNECVYPGTCISLSTLSKDAKCKCRKGYAPDSHDSRRCEPVDKNLNENATLIFGKMNEGIEQFSLSQGTVTRIQNFSSVFFALDVMHRTNTMFWSDIYGNIFTAPIREGATKTVVLRDLGSEITALAVDWVYGHLYFADRLSNTISVANLDGSMKKYLNFMVTETSAIVVDPLSGWMYWADLLAQNIGRAAMDGSQGEVLANTEPKQPNGLALDMTQNRLYWTTNKFFLPGSIHSMNVDGSDQKIVLQATPPTFPIGCFESITTFGDFVYFREHHTKSVYRTNKCGGVEATAFYSTPNPFNAQMTIQVHHFSKQPAGVNYCENRISGQCSHLCFRLPATENETVATKCACPDELTLSSDQRTCYAPDPHGGRRCGPVDKNLNENATLIFGSIGGGGGIEQFSLSQQTVTRIQNHSTISNALDVTYQTNTMFWSDKDGNINTALIREGAAKTVVLSDSGSSFSSLAVDWVYKHLYFGDSKRNTISVANLDGSMRKVLFTTRDTNAIVVDPLSGWIYWADGKAKNIERAALDGSQRKVLASTKPKSPHGLALDKTHNRLYWTTSYLINSMNVDGSERKLVFRVARPTFSHTQFWSITTFGDFVYWKDIITASVYRTNKCGGDGATKIPYTANEKDRLMTLQVYHFSKQPEGFNYCENRIGGQCSHLCFRIPSTENQTVATTCACPDGLTLTSDQRTCT